MFILTQVGLVFKSGFGKRDLTAFQPHFCTRLVEFIIPEARDNWGQGQGGEIRGAVTSDEFAP